MSGRFRSRRWTFPSRVRYARGRYNGRRVGSSARRARGNMRAANQQNDISNVTINLMKKIKTGVTGYTVGEKNFEIGTCALNIFDLLRQSEFYKSYSNMYDQFRINRIQVKVTPVTWKTYNQFNLPHVGNIVSQEGDENITTDAFGDPNYPGYTVEEEGRKLRYTGNYGAPVDDYGVPSTSYIVPQALTIVTAWDRTGLDDTQLSTGLSGDEIPTVNVVEGNNITPTPVSTSNYVFTTIGDKITTYSSAKSSQLVAGANFNCVRYLYPSSQQEKSLYFSTSELVEQLDKPDSHWFLMKKVSSGYDNKNITNLHSDPNCPFKPTFLIGVLKVDDLGSSGSSAAELKNISNTTGQIYPVTFNLEFDIGVTFRGLRKSQVV